MITLLRINRNYVLPFVILLLISLIMLLWVPKGMEVIWLNQFYNTTMNWFFVWVTRMGEEWVAIAIGCLLLMYSKMRTFFGYLLATLLVSILVNVFKHVVFDHAVRPKLYLSEYPLQFVEDVYINAMNSFPSGHTATAFVVFTYLAFIVSPRFKAWVLIFPVLTGLSRIYLAQHFLLDVIAGSILGFTVAFFSYWVFHKEDNFHKPLWNKRLFDRWASKN